MFSIQVNYSKAQFEKAGKFLTELKKGDPPGLRTILEQYAQEIIAKARELSPKSGDPDSHNVEEFGIRYAEGWRAAVGHIRGGKLGFELYHQFEGVSGNEFGAYTRVGGTIGSSYKGFRQSREYAGDAVVGALEYGSRPFSFVAKRTFGFQDERSDEAGGLGGRVVIRKGTRVRRSKREGFGVAQKTRSWLETNIIPRMAGSIKEAFYKMLNF